MPRGLVSLRFALPCLVCAYFAITYLLPLNRTMQKTFLQIAQNRVEARTAILNMAPLLSLSPLPTRFLPSALWSRAYYSHHRIIGGLSSYSVKRGSRRCTLRRKTSRLVPSFREESLRVSFFSASLSQRSQESDISKVKNT